MSNIDHMNLEEARFLLKQLRRKMANNCGECVIMLNCPVCINKQLAVMIDEFEPIPDATPWIKFEYDDESTWPEDVKKCVIKLEKAESNSLEFIGHWFESYKAFTAPCDIKYSIDNVTHYMPIPEIQEGE